MKLLLNILVLASFSSSLILAFAIHDGPRVDDGITISANHKSFFFDDPSKGPHLRFLAESNSPVKFGQNVTYTLRALSLTKEKKNLTLNLTAESASHELIKTVDLNLKFPPSLHYNVMVTWTIPPEWYTDKLGNNNEVIINTLASVVGKDQVWNNKLIIELKK